MQKTIKNYKLLQKVGQGQYAHVYKAQNSSVKGYFAVKVMTIQKFKSAPKLTQLTNNQIKILADINHPNIIKFIQMLQTSTHFYLVYQYCNGGTLQDKIKKYKTISAAESIYGFAVLYQKKILHRDLKPTNILFHNNVIKIADFGFCKQLVKDNDMAKSHVGSPIYMAPQILKGQFYDCKADIWSLGVVLFQMLYGRCPYEQCSIPKLLAMISTSALHFPRYPKINGQLKKFLQSILTVKAIDRISPLILIKYPMDNLLIDKDQMQEVKLDYKGIIKFTRKNIQYLAETLLILSRAVHQLVNLRLAYLVYKVILNVWRITKKNCIYWQQIKHKNQQNKWDQIYDQQIASLQNYGQIVRQAIKKCDNSLKLKLQIDKQNIDTKYFIDCVKQINDENYPTLKDRIINCVLINIHYQRVLQKKKPNWIDYSNSEREYKSKEEYCLKYARYNY